MNAQTESMLSSDAAYSDAIEWALALVSAEQVERISEMPWATLYRVQGARGAAYLKIVPPAQAGLLATAAAIATAFPSQVPAVIGLNAERGWLLSRDHAARTLDYEAEDEDLLAVVTTYARLQARAATDPGLLGQLPVIDTAALLPCLLAFLEPTAAGTPSDTNLDERLGPVRADYFLGAESAARYQRLLRRRLPLIDSHIARARDLPPTLNHGDLRPPNAAIDEAGGCTLIDWDDAVVGPAGLSLHGLFSGCTLPTILLSDSPVARAAAAGPDRAADPRLCRRAGRRRLCQYCHA